VFHSDRGSEFAAKDLRQLLAQVGAVQSMSRKGDCWDNAVAESFLSTLEFEGPSTTVEHDGVPLPSKGWLAARRHSSRIPLNQTRTRRPRR